MTRTILFRGSIAALVTPFNEEFEVDFAAFEKLIEWHIAEGTDALVVCGTTGEASTLTTQEHLLVMQRAVQVADKRIPIIAGTGTNCTRSSVAMTQGAKECGVDGCLVIFPYYNRPTVEGCARHFQEVARVGLPMILYYHPKRTGVQMSPEELAQMSKIPGVVGIKDASEDLEYAAAVMKHTAVPLLSGSDLLTLPLMQAGAVGVISVLANLVPARWKEFVGGQQAGTEALYPLGQALMAESNPQGVKYALSLLGKCAPHLRLPLLQPRSETKHRIARAMWQAGLLPNEQQLVRPSVLAERPQ